jgi:hypothetical protein
MLTLETRARVEGLSARQVIDAVLAPTDESYRAWWPETHPAFHIVRRGEDHVGYVVWMDQFIGRRRRMSAVVVEADPGRRTVWQLRRGVRLPARLELEAADRDGACDVRHGLRVGWPGAGRWFDPVPRTYVTRRFAEALGEHVRTECRGLGGTLTLSTGHP